MAQRWEIQIDVYASRPPVLSVYVSSDTGEARKRLHYVREGTLDELRRIAADNWPGVKIVEVAWGQTASGTPEGVDEPRNPLVAMVLRLEAEGDSELRIAPATLMSEGETGKVKHAIAAELRRILRMGAR